tara:strand:- start:264 stop:428 length:165 start_codon:yes stop_codon:yes gene_type:complete
MHSAVWIHGAEKLKDLTLMAIRKMSARLVLPSVTRMVKTFVVVRALAAMMRLKS